MARGGGCAEGGLALGHLGHLPLHLLALPLQLHHPALHLLQVQLQQLLLVAAAAGADGGPPPRRLLGRVGLAADLELGLLRRQRLHCHARRDPPVLGKVLARLQGQLLVVEASAQRRAVLQGKRRVRLHPPQFFLDKGIMDRTPQFSKM
jgi:hypothetical protein